MSDGRLPRRQRTSPPHTVSPVTKVSEPCPGVVFKVTFEGNRKATLNLKGLSRADLAAQAAQLIWDKVQRQAPLGSSGLVDFPQAAMRAFCDHLDESDGDGRVETFGDIVAQDIDDFDDYLRRRYPNSNMSDVHLRAFLALLREGQEKGLTDNRLKHRLEYQSKLPPVDGCTPREPFPAITMARLRVGATAGVKQAIRRRCMGQRRIRDGRRAMCRLPLANDLAWMAANDGPPSHMSKLDCEVFRRNRGVTVAAILAEIYPSSIDAVAFAILIAEETGIPIESVRDLDENCLSNERKGFATLRYTKRRAGGHGFKTIDVSTKRFSAGWLIKVFKRLSEHARHKAAPDLRGWLFLGYAHRRIIRLKWAEAQVGAFLKHHDVKDETGAPMVTAQLSRIRKNVKAADYKRVGGDLKRFATDHSRQVAATHYARIRANVEIHEHAIAQGLQAALDVSTRAAVETSGELAEQGDDVAVAQCLDFNNSPFSPPGRPCGAPLFGCLDCANAVVSEANLPALFHLLYDVVQKRQEMDVGSWIAAFGASYARILLILDRFPKPTVEKAMEEAAYAFGRSWSPAQLAYKV